MPDTATGAQTPNFIEEERVKFQKRLDEINEEIGPRLREREALQVVLNTFASALRQTQPRTPGTARRGRRGHRMEEFLNDVKANDGTKVSESAERIGVSQNYLYRVAEKATSEGRVTKDDDGGYHLMQNAAAAA